MGAGHDLHPLPEQFFCCLCGEFPDAGL
jgi:hypothetical protein